MKFIAFAYPLGLTISLAQIGCAHVELIDLAGSLEPLRARFNAERDRPRIVAIFSPV